MPGREVGGTKTIAPNNAWRTASLEACHLCLLLRCGALLHSSRVQGQTRTKDGSGESAVIAPLCLVCCEIETLLKTDSCLVWWCGVYKLEMPGSMVEGVEDMTLAVYTCSFFFCPSHFSRSRLSSNPESE